MIAGLAKSDTIFNLVFFISITSVLLQGTTLPFVAGLLHVVLPGKTKKRRGIEYELTDTIKSEMQQILLPASSNVIGKKIVQLSVPSAVNIMALQRGDVYISPNGSTRLQANDKLFILAEDKNALQQLAQSLDIKL